MNQFSLIVEQYVPLEELIGHFQPIYAREKDRVTKDYLMEEPRPKHYCHSTKTEERLIAKIKNHDSY